MDVCSSSKDAHVANGSSQSALAIMAVVFSAAVAFAGCFVFAAGSLNGFTS